MPFFFISSGLTTSERTLSLPFHKFFIRKSKKLLLFGILLRLLYQVSNIMVGMEISIRAFLNPLNEWFIPSLFLANLLFYFLYRVRIKWVEHGSMIYWILIIGICMELAKLYNDFGLHGKPEFIPFPIDISLVGLVFFIVGFLLQKYMQNENTLFRFIGMCWSERLVFTIIIIGIIILEPVNSLVNLFGMNFGNSEIFFIISATFTSYLIIIGCKALENRGGEKVANLLEVLGKHTLLLYGGHQIYFKMLNAYFLVHPMSEEFGISWILIYFISFLAIFIPASFLMEKYQSLKKRR